MFVHPFKLRITFSSTHEDAGAHLGSMLSASLSEPWECIVDAARRALAGSLLSRQELPGAQENEPVVMELHHGAAPAEWTAVGLQVAVDAMAPQLVEQQNLPKDGVFANAPERSKNFGNGTRPRGIRLLGKQSRSMRDTEAPTEAIAQ
ncbi:hypothetical protein cyc_01532 [Cyclospora cayetanensis]|uniref:Uncharacterized protein n=1 Tax=Cyclospora cayetanensis TaxID=88456 RepID=A0A1D3D700_9EIME|nr:hypothetical protein cyc_01532 [Cyclospora cayetanensis]